MESNIINVSFGPLRTKVTKEMYRLDMEQYIRFTDIDLPEYYRVDFGLTEMGDTISVIGTADGVLIPDNLLTNPGKLHAWVWLDTGTYGGKTYYHVIIPIKKRGNITDIEPTPEEQRTIDSLIAAMNDAVDDAETSATAALGFAENAEASADRAEEAAQTIGDKVERAEAAAQAAGVSATRAEDAAEDAEGYRDEAEQSAGSASSSAEDARNSKETAIEKAAEAEQSAAQAAESAASIEGDVQEAEQAAQQAEASASAASQSATAAQAAQTGAEAAQAAVEEAAESIEESAEQIAQNTSDIADLQEDSVELKNAISQLVTRLKSGAEEDAELHLGFYLDENGDLCQVEEDENNG